MLKKPGARFLLKQNLKMVVDVNPGGAGRGLSAEWRGHAALKVFWTKHGRVPSRPAPEAEVGGASRVGLTMVD